MNKTITDTVDTIYNAYDDLDPRRGIYCNRSLNLRSIKAIGYDMDYTLIHYNVNQWEARAYAHIKAGLLQAGWPIEDLHFQPFQVTRGLIIDYELGNIVKANRFGYIKRAMHGTQPLEYSEMRKNYTRTLVHLSEPRWLFMNTLFSISAATIYAQLVDMLNAGKLPEVLSYAELFQRIQQTLDTAHLEGVLKSEIMSDPERYVELDPDVPLMLMDQRQAGKKLMLITNSEWNYTAFMMDYAINQFLPDGTSWEDLFDIVMVSARKPDFFTTNSPVFEVVDKKDGLLHPTVGGLKDDRIYLGGNAVQLEEYLGCSGDEILYIGDHLFSDVNVSKNILRWRTALIIREFERELETVQANDSSQTKIAALMDEKKRLEDRYSQLRLERQRNEKGYTRPTEHDPQVLKEMMRQLRKRLIELDGQIRPLAVQDGKRFNQFWGYLMRAGNDKSHFTRQVERYADIYTSRVSNFLHYTPFMYFRAPRGSLPHDHGFKHGGSEGMDRE